MKLPINRHVGSLDLGSVHGHPLYTEVVQLNDHVSALTPLSTLALITLTDDFGAALPSDANDLRKAWNLSKAFAHPLALTFPDTSLFIKVVKRLERKIDEAGTVIRVAPGAARISACTLARVRKLEATRARRATNRELIVVATMILRMIGTPVFSDRTEFSVTRTEF